MSYQALSAMETKDSMTDGSDEEFSDYIERLIEENKDMDSLKKVNSDLKNKIKTMEKIRNLERIRVLEDTIRHLKEQNSKSEDLLSGETQTEDKRTDVEDMNKQMKKLALKYEQLKTNADQLETLRQMYNDLKNLYEEAKCGMSSENSSLKTELNMSQIRIKELEDNKRQLEKEKEESDTRRAELEVTLEAVETENSSLKNNFEVLQHRCNELEISYKELEEAKSELSEKLSVLELKCVELEDMDRQMSDNFQLLNNKLDNRFNKIEEKIEKIEESDHRCGGRMVEPKPLYLAETWRDLFMQANQNSIIDKKHTWSPSMSPYVNDAIQNMDIHYEKAKKAQITGDEERAYLSYHRYSALMDLCQEWNKRNCSLNVIDLDRKLEVFKCLNDLENSLTKRYSAREESQKLKD